MEKAGTVLNCSTWEPCKLFLMFLVPNNIIKQTTAEMIEIKAFAGIMAESGNCIERRNFTFPKISCFL